MKSYTKETLLSIINEQINQEMDIDEMARGTYSTVWVEDKDASSETTPIKIFSIEDFASIMSGPGIPKSSITPNSENVLSLDPEFKLSTGTYKDTGREYAERANLVNQAICYRRKICPTSPGNYLYVFYNYGYYPTQIKNNKELYKKKDFYVWVNENDMDKPLGIFSQPIRHSYFGTHYEYKEDPQYSSEQYSKRYLHYDTINELFNKEEVKLHLYKCGIPPINAAKDYDQPITHKRNDHKYSPPNYNFLLHGLWESEDVQSAMNRIAGYREAIAFGDEPPKLPSPEKMPRSSHYPHSYARGGWDAGQKLGIGVNLEKAKNTKNYRLWMKAMAGGILNFYIETTLQILGGVRDGNMIMTANFSTDSMVKSSQESIPDYKIDPITPISVTVEVPIPEGVNVNAEMDSNLQRGDRFKKDFHFLKSVYQELADRLEEKILQLDPNEVLTKYLVFNTEDVEDIINESLKRKKKIMITESQLRLLLPKPKKIKITESQLKMLRKQFQE